ncbi:MAG: hypothetical protein ABSF14_23895 [Terriglobia bacterium]|jgi:hypothetical protein
MSAFLLFLIPGAANRLPIAANTGFWELFAALGSTFSWETYILGDSLKKSLKFSGNLGWNLPESSKVHPWGAVVTWGTGNWPEVTALKSE